MLGTGRAGRRRTRGRPSSASKRCSRRTRPTGTGPHEIAFLPYPEGHLQAWVGNFRDHSLTLVDIDPDSPRRFTAVANLR